MRNYEIWINELFSELRTISNESELRRLWSGADRSSISSFSEEVAHVFDDYDIDGFIEAGPDKANLNSVQFEALCKFRDRFSTYVDSVAPTPLASIGYETVLADPQWFEVMKAAQDFVALIDVQSSSS